MGRPDPDPLPFVRGALPAAFRRWEVVLPPGGARPYDPAEWRGALVVVAGGDIELRCRRGRLTRLCDGAVGFLEDLPLAQLRNPGPVAVRLIAVARASDEFASRTPSHPPTAPNDPRIPRGQEPQP